MARSRNYATAAARTVPFALAPQMGCALGQVVQQPLAPFCAVVLSGICHDPDHACGSNMGRTR